jgi:hypothetical protein
MSEDVKRPDGAAPAPTPSKEPITADKLRALGFKIIESRGDGFIIPIGGPIQKPKPPK